MLTGIKNIINGKLAIQKHAASLLTEHTEMDLDELIILGEEGDMELPDDTAVEEEVEDDEGDQPELPTAKDNDIDDHDAMNDDITGDDDHGDAHTDDNVDDHDAMNDDISGELPEPIGAQTGEPVKDDDDDIMNVEIDLRSNTMSDTLPIPPSTAGEAIASDTIGTQHVDSGFGGEVTESSHTGEKIGSEFFGGLFKPKAPSASEPASPEWLKSCVSKINGLVVNKVTELFSEEKFKDISDLKSAMITSIKGDEFKDSYVGKFEKNGNVYDVRISDPPSWYGSIDNNYRDKLKELMDEGIRSINESLKESGIELKLFVDSLNIYIHTNITEEIAGKLTSVTESAITEGITLAGGMEGGDAGTDTTGDPVPEDNSSAESAPDTGSAEEGENSVTAAVRDKVNETETVDDTGVEGDLPNSKEALLKKLGNLTKNLEDVKKAIMDAGKQ